MGYDSLVELFKNVWVNQQCVSAFWITDLTEETTTWFLRRTKEKVTGYKFTIVFAANSVPLEYAVATKQERDKVISILKGIGNE
jgi:hypothetical protein